MKFLMSTAHLSIVVAGLFCSGSFAESGLSLNQAMDEGLKNNPQLKASWAALSEAQWKKKESLGGFLPKVDIVANHFFDLKYQEIQITPTSIFESIYPKTSYGAQATLNLFDGMKTTYFNNASKANVEAADYELNHTKMATENSISLKYFQALGAQVLASVAESNVKTLSDHLKRAQELLRQGEFTKVDVLKIQVQVEQAVPEKLAAADNAFLTRKNLSEAMGIEGDDRPLQETLPVPKEQLVKNINANEASSSALSSGRLDLKALQKRVEASDEFYKASRSIWMPKVNLVADYEHYNNRNFSFTDSQKFKDSYALGVNLVWNLFDGGSSYARQEQSYYQKIQLEQKAKKMILSSANEVEFWKRRYLNSAVLYSAKLRSVDASKESVRIYQNGLKAGTRTNSDLLDAELDLDRSEAGVVKAQVDAVEALLNLELAMGRRL
ncbi:MAG: TolC family protein [Bacteriovorax sp.]|nr:TolC family protein [Bacteriovorax sp.]